MITFRSSLALSVESGIWLFLVIKQNQLEIDILKITFYVIFMLHIHTWSMLLILLILWSLMGLVIIMINEGRFDHVLA